MSLLDSKYSTFQGRGFVSFDLQTKRPSFLQSVPTKPHQNRFNFQARKQPLDDVKLPSSSNPMIVIRQSSQTPRQICIQKKHTILNCHLQGKVGILMLSNKLAFIVTPNVGVPFSKMIARRPLAQASPYKNEFIRFQNIEKYKNRSNNERNEPVRLFRGTLARNRKESQYPGYLDILETLEPSREEQSQNIRQHFNQNEQVSKSVTWAYSQLLQPENQSDITYLKEINAADNTWSLQNSKLRQQWKSNQSLEFPKECQENQEQIQFQKIGNSFNQLLVEHGFVAAEKQPKPKFSPFNNQYKKQIVIESANPHKYQSLQGFVFQNSSDSDVSLDEKDTKLLENE